MLESTSCFEYIILLFIGVSCVHLTFDNPLNDPNGELAFWLNIVDYTTTFVFSIEFFVKVITFGFALNGKKSYLRHAWNQLDFLILLVSYTSLFSKMNISTLKILRMLRVMRPLRILSRN